MLCILKDINNILFHLYGHEKFDINNDELWGNYTNIYKKGEGDLFSLEWNYYYFLEFFSFDFDSNLP
jgi:hypothetical protein